ncbi:MAG: hypothetical protein MZV64_72700 [Ignavibacteriales bacterium]|nr:hypothetical protein [Ignavibacteriales bacterium]
MCQRLHHAVLGSLRDGAIPVVLGGDHSLGAGSVAAASDWAHQRGPGDRPHLGRRPRRHEHAGVFRERQRPRDAAGRAGRAGAGRTGPPVGARAGRGPVAHRASGHSRSRRPRAASTSGAPACTSSRCPTSTARAWLPWRSRRSPLPARERRAFTCRSTWTPAIPPSRPAWARRCAAASASGRRTCSWKWWPTPASSSRSTWSKSTRFSTCRTRRRCWVWTSRSRRSARQSTRAGFMTCAAARCAAGTGHEPHAEGDDDDDTIHDPDARCSAAAGRDGPGGRTAEAAAQPAGAGVGDHRRGHHHDRLRPAVDARAEDHGRAGAVRQGLAHRRERGDDAQDDGGDRDRRRGRPGRHLHALHAARREGLEAHHQQADRPVGHAVRPGPGPRARRPHRRRDVCSGRAVHDHARRHRRGGRPAHDGVGERRS